MEAEQLEPEQLMKFAIEACRQGIAAGQSPFGCAIASGGKLLAVRHNTVIQSTDITAHAEVNALRSACLAAGDILLPGAIVATTCEPCPMCMAALHWARVERVYYGASIEDAKAAGFNELQFPAEELARRGGSRVTLQAGVLADQCRDLFREWKNTPSHRAY